MGCDYYIIRFLHIYYNDNDNDNDNDYLEFEVDREKGYYYYDDYDEDDENYDEMVNEYKKNILTVKMKPIIIYNNNNFNKLSSEHKYKNVVEYEMNAIDKKWCDVTKIIKIEKRFER